MDIKFTENVNQ